MFEDLKERIKYIRKAFNIGSQEKLSKLLNVNTARVKSIETGRVKDLSAMEANIIVKNFNLNIDWLLTGKGEMLQKAGQDLISSEAYEIDVLNARAGAGTGVYNYEVEVIDKIVLDKSFFKTPPDIAKIKIIEVDGDSMEPTLKDRDHVVIDETKTDRVNGIYAIQLDGQLLIKRLQFKLDGTVIIISDNTRYEPEIYDPHNSQLPCKIIGKKILTIQR